MSEHTITVEWKRETPDFAYQSYNRDHNWTFDAGITVRASATPAYLGSESCVDRRVESLAEEIKGLPLWIDPGQTYEHVTVPIGPGEVVIFHSDGVTAVIDHQSHSFDLNCLRLAIAQAPGGATSAGQSILDAIRRFGQGRAQVDDITLLCIGRAVPTTLFGGEVSR